MNANTQTDDTDALHPEEAAEYLNYLAGNPISRDYRFEARDAAVRIQFDDDASLVMLDNLEAWLDDIEYGIHGINLDAEFIVLTPDEEV